MTQAEYDELKKQINQSLDVVKIVAVETEPKPKG